MYFGGGNEGQQVSNIHTVCCWLCFCAVSSRFSARAAWYKGFGLAGSIRSRAAVVRLFAAQSPCKAHGVDEPERNCDGLVRERVFERMRCTQRRTFLSRSWKT